MAHRVISPRCINSVAIGGIADIARSTAAPGSDANDPKRTSRHPDNMSQKSLVAVSECYSRAVATALGLDR